jgi:hypothetical protein
VRNPIQILTVSPGWQFKSQLGMAVLPFRYGSTYGHLADVASDLNSRPRRILNDHTPAERFARLLTTHT